jgi:hypothetical protein
MRTYGRVAVDKSVNPTGFQWVEVLPDINNDPSYIYITTLIQVLLLNLAESPFYANYGIPAQKSVLSQIYPDWYVTLTQQFFSGYFANLSITRVPDDDALNYQPTYSVSIITNQGAIYQAKVAI